MVVSIKSGTQYRAPNTIILLMGTPKRVPLILGNPHIKALKAGKGSIDQGSPLDLRLANPQTNMV